MTLIRRTPPVQPPAPAQEIPQSVFKAGYYTPEVARRRGRKYRGLMLAIEGRSDTGKTEFMLSAPGPGSILAMDRGFDAVFDNPMPPPTRRQDFGILRSTCRALVNAIASTAPLASRSMRDCTARPSAASA